MVNLIECRVLQGLDVLFVGIVAVHDIAMNCLVLMEATMTGEPFTGSQVKSGPFRSAGWGS